MQTPTNRATSDERRVTRAGAALLLTLFLAAPLAAQADSGGVASSGGAVASGGQDVTAVGGIQEDVLFYIFAGLTVASALGVVVSTSVVRMATWLFATFGAVAVLFFLLQAHFLAVVQLIVYVGGILVLIVFGIMLTSTSPWLRFRVRRREVVISGVVCAVLFAAISHVLYHAEWNASRATVENIKIDALGRTLLTDYLVPFELAAILLMVIMIGAAYLARQPHR